MRLTRFEVCGYKNFTRPVALEELGPINVLHGDNNVGKSNLLEAMHLFFRALSRGTAGDQLPLNRPREFTSPEFLEKTGHNPAFIFNLWTRDPIEMSAALVVDPAALERAKIKPLFDVSRVEIAVQLEWIDGAILFSVTRFAFADGKDATGGETSDRKLQFLQRFALFIARNMLVHDQEDRPRFALIDETRRLKSPGGPRERDDEGIISQTLLKSLYQTRDSLDEARVESWELLSELVVGCFPQLGDGELMTRYDIKARRAGLVWIRDKIRMPIELLGSGIQQAVALLGQLAMTDATLVAIEEPECNLRYELQMRLRDAFRRVVDDPRGPDQLFMTSHSPAFEVGDRFYGMQMADGAPVVEPRPVDTADAYLGMQSVRPPDGASAPLSYVTSEGLVRLPPTVRRRLGIGKGGSILFHDRGDGTVEVLTAAEVARRIDGVEGERDNEQ